MKYRTKEEIMGLKENDLRSHVLIPLFKKMGFKDVDHYHGANERGKDITMWKFDEIENRRNHVVVVKAGKISGQANNKRSSAQNVYFQIQQCFAHPFLDKNSGDYQTAHHCWVMTNGEITTEARDTIPAILKNTGYAQNITFVGVDKLMEMIDKYFPEIKPGQQLQESLQLYQTFSENWLIDVSTHNGQIRKFLKPKHDKADQEQPIVLTGNLHFPDTPEGKAFYQQYHDFYKKGTTLHVKPGFFDGFAFPDFLKPYLLDGDDPQGLVLVPLITDHKTIPIRMECKNDTGATILRTKLSVVRRGTEEVVVDNSKADDIFDLKLILAPSSKSFSFSIKDNYEGANVKSVLDAYIFLQTMQNRGYITIIEENTDTVLLSCPIDYEGGVKPSTEARIKLYDSLVLIQKEFQTPLTVPNDPISEEQYLSILETVEIIRTGQLIRTFTSLTVTRNIESAKELLQFFETGAKSAVVKDTEFEKRLIFGTWVNVGRYIDVLLLEMQQSEVERVRKAIQNGNETIDVVLVPVEQNPCYTFYEKWYKDIENFERIKLLQMVIDIISQQQNTTAN